MKYKIFLFLTLIILTACLRISSKPVTGDYNPVTGFLPKDASENLTYDVNIKDLNNDEIIMIISNELYNNMRDNMITFEKKFNASVSSKNTKNTIDTSKPMIIERTFDYDYTKKMLPKTTDKSLVSKNIVKNVLGDIKNFNALKIGSSEKNVVIKAKLVKLVNKNNRTVRFWVDEKKYSGVAYVPKQINDTMITSLSEKFIENSYNIYADLTHIYGKEWFEGSSTSDYLLYGAKTIDILLFDINDNYEGGRVVGYFNPDDLFMKNYAFSSNESVMFYLDAYSLADASPWEATAYWPDNAISTLAHEFMHLITFYQKTILRNGKISVWLNEMMSMIAEDLVSYHAGTYGPRGVSGTVLNSGYSNNGSGRLAYANYFNHYPVNSYRMSSYIEYAVTYSYGAYLLRNYGTGDNGLLFLRDIVWSEYQDVNAIENAIRNRGYNKTFVETLQDWTKAIVLSNEIFTGKEKFKYSTGSGFISSVDGKSFRFGDINMYKYMDNPTFYLTGGEWLPKLNRGNNLLFYLGKGNENFTMKLSVPKYSKVQFIIINSSGKFDFEKTNRIKIYELFE